VSAARARRAASPAAVFMAAKPAYQAETGAPRAVYVTL
jgi:hypothetical protein